MSKKITPLYAETRILLDLLGLGIDEVSKSGFVPSKPIQYQQAFKLLIEEECFSESLWRKRYKKYTLNNQGKQRLAKNLVNSEFFFDGIIGAKTANGLLQVARQQLKISEVEAPNNLTNGNRKGFLLSSYEVFSDATLSTYDQLNNEYQFEDLVPIYRIRRRLGEQVSRAQFNEWLLEMQANDVFQLIGGEMPELTTDKADDSVKTSLGGMRYYAKRL